MNKEEMKQRTKPFATNIIQLVGALPQGRIIHVLGKPLLRSGTSVGSNCQAAGRAKSTADFIAKLGVVEEEMDETIYWIRLLVESSVVQSVTVKTLLKEANELLAKMRFLN